MTDATVVRGSAVAPSPWANGGGLTRELWVGHDADGTRWRLSMATVEGRGEFSELPGVARSLMLVSGDVRLRIGDDRARALAGPIEFDGATPVSYEAPVTSEDLGVMVWGARPAGLRVVAGPGPLGLDPASARAAVVLGGGAAVGEERLGFRDVVVLGEHRVELTLRDDAAVVVVGR